MEYGVCDRISVGDLVGIVGFCTTSSLGLIGFPRGLDTSGTGLSFHGEALTMAIGYMVTQWNGA